MRVTQANPAFPQTNLGAGDGTVRTWEASSATPLRVLEHDAPVTCIQMHGEVLFAGTGVAAAEAGAGATPVRPGGCEVVVWDVASGALVNRLQGHRGSVMAMGLCYDGRVLKLFSAASDRQLLEWDADKAW